MSCKTGLDALRSRGFDSLIGASVGLVCNQATIASDLRHLLDLLVPLHQRGELKIQRVFGPQHGLFGHTQDNMIEWEGTVDARTGLKFVSLYGEHREPTTEMLQGIELLVIDLPDIGVRYYTFAWTMALCLKKCAELRIPVLVLDRPNPIGGTQVEGTVLDPAFASFVGLYPLPTRHGMTLGEIATYLRQNFFPNVQLTVERVQGWNRGQHFDETGLPWAMPSPNMPTLDTAIVYPGGCLLEATNLSEGRGTTRPFEIFGAPWLDAWRFCDALNSADLRGCTFRPYQFEPTFHKHAKQLCEGAFLHVTDRRTFEPVLGYVAVMQEAVRQAPNDFAWKQPPYEYEYEKLPIDILAGNAWLREAIEDRTSPKDVRERFAQECSAFAQTGKEALLYQTVAP